MLAIPQAEDMWYPYNTENPLLLSIFSWIPESLWCFRKCMSIASGSDICQLPAFILMGAHFGSRYYHTGMKIHRLQKLNDVIVWPSFEPIDSRCALIEHSCIDIPVFNNKALRVWENLVSTSLVQLEATSSATAPLSRTQDIDADSSMQYPKKAKAFGALRGHFIANYSRSQVLRWIDALLTWKSVESAWTVCWAWRMKTASLCCIHKFPCSTHNENRTFLQSRR